MLSVQAANATNSDEQRGYLNLEARQLQIAINQVIESTSWNEQNLLGEGFNKTLKLGAGAQDDFRVEIPKLSLFSTTFNTYQSTSKGTSISGVDASVGQLTINNINIGLSSSLSASNLALAINNQTALLKVIDNAIYFSITSDKTVSTEGVANIEVNSEIKSVPVRLVMSVTPFIDEYENVTLNVRPTISRIIDTVLDPTPDLAEAGVTNKIPVIQVREVESLLKVKSGETAVIGGLMQEDNRKESVGIPYLQRIPYIGRLFSYKEDIKKKTELVIFIRPIIVLDRAILEKNHF